MPSNTPWLDHGYFNAELDRSDKAVATALDQERQRQNNQIELIASENFVSRAVLQAQGSVLTNKTVEGYPGARYYGGAQFADRIEQLAIDRARALFGCEYANVQPHSGSNANQAVFLALLKAGDTILSMDVACGGHISHGHPATQTGQRYHIVNYGVERENGRIDYRQVDELARRHRPQLIIAGGSAYPRAIEFATMRSIADSVGARLLVDMAHFAGLVACGHYPHPFPHAHVVTSTTYKSLRGGRGGFVLCNDPGLAKRIDLAVFPGVQGSVLMHGVAGKAVCFGEALRTDFSVYNRRVLENARTLASTLEATGINIVSGGTDCGLLLVDLRPSPVTGAVAVDALETAGLTCNKNLVPFDPRPPETASGLRLSSSAGTTRGFGAHEFSMIADWIAQILKDLEVDRPSTPELTRQIRREVSALCARFPLYPDT